MPSDRLRRRRSRAATGVAAGVVAALVTGLAVVAAVPATAAAQTPSAARTTARTGSPASVAAPPASSDATLDALGLSGNNTGLTPAFDAGTTYYEAAGADDPTLTVSVATRDPGATAEVRLRDQVVPVVSGQATLDLAVGRNDVRVVVTAADATTTRTYRVATWRGVAPQARVLSVQHDTTTVYGGERTTLTLRDVPGPDGDTTNGCHREYTVGGAGADVVLDTWDPSAGVRRVTLVLPALSTAGRKDLRVQQQCYFWDASVLPASGTTVEDAYTYTAGSTWRVTSADVPDPLSTGSPITLRGNGVATGNALKVWIEAPDGRVLDAVRGWRHSAEGTAQYYVAYAPDDAAATGSGPRTLKVADCRGEPAGSTACTVLWSRTVTWRAPAPSRVSFSPASGPVTGGTTLRISGRHISSGAATIQVSVGGVPAVIRGGLHDAAEQDSLRAFTTDLDVLEVVVPPAARPGPVQVVWTTEYGSATARGTFTYAARPAVTSLSPATVANTGGSVVTVRGTAFGTSGRPTVLVDGVRSPFVTRVSATELRAVVPDLSGTTGAVDVRVTSPQGGGTSVPATLTLVDPSVSPVVASVTPRSGRPGDVVTVSGSQLGTAATVGVSVGGVWAVVRSATATRLTVELPAGARPGARDLLVGTPSGRTVRAGALTVVGDPSVTSVSPARVPSYATGAARRVVLRGTGFGAGGTVRVGSAAAVRYTATDGGTRIPGVLVPAGPVGTVAVTVDPDGAAPAARTTVLRTGPVVTYTGADPYDPTQRPADEDDRSTGVVLAVDPAGGSVVRIQGTGFGPSGVVRVGGVPATVRSWSGTAVVLTAPPHAVGRVPVTVTPTGSALSATTSLRYVPVLRGPQITGVASVSDLGHADRRDFDPVSDLDDTFTVAGSRLAGTTTAATRVVVGGRTVVPSAVTATSLTFRAPRGLPGGWAAVTVVTDAGSVSVDRGVRYLVAGTEVTVTPPSGLCTRTPRTGTGDVRHDPASVSVTNGGAAFGASGTVTVDGVPVTGPTYGAGEVRFAMSDLSADLADPWGPKTVVVTPADPALPAQEVRFTCQVPVSATTTANGSAAHLTVPAGTAYTVGTTTSGFLGPFTASAPSGYEYVSADDYALHGFDGDVRAGVPAASGDWYVRVSTQRASYDRVMHGWSSAPAPVRVTVVGTPLTVTPTSANGATFTYSGPLGDGTGSTPADIGYTLSRTLPPGDRITKVVWEHRNAGCPADDGWEPGLPQHVAKDDACGRSDPATTVAWQVRVKAVEMRATGTDRSVYYALTRPSLTLTITPRDLMIASARADRLWDGTDAATLAGLEYTGLVPGDAVTLDSGPSTASFADASVGADRPVTFPADLALTGAAARDYRLTNPRPTVRGTISPRTPALALGSDRRTLLLTGVPTATLTGTVTDVLTGSAPDVAAAVPDATFSTRTPGICAVSGATVTALAAGTCVVAGRVPASSAYTASAEASLELDVLPAAQTVLVVADDLTVATGDAYEATGQAVGLFDGDTVDGVIYEYYDGDTRLDGPPSLPGTYRIVPSGGTLHAVDDAAYTNPSALRYVEGTLVVTPLPPSVTGLSPASGTTAGGTTVTVTGTRLDTVTSLTIGGVTLRPADFTVDPDGTRLVFRTPATSRPRVVDVVLAAGTATTSDVYTYTAPVAAPQLDLTLSVAVGRELAGGRATMRGGGLRPASRWRLVMHSTPVLLATGTTDGSGRFRATLAVPAKACVTGGLHQLVLTGTAPDGSTLRDTQWVVLDDTCSVAARPAGKPSAGRRATVGWFLFDLLSAELDAGDRRALDRAATALRGAKVVTVTGYTQTQKKDPAAVAANKRLALRRANAVAAYLRSVGVTGRFVTVGKGPVDPVSRTEQRLNRRVVVSATW